MKILFVHCRRGLYQLTKCRDCGHIFECGNCDAKLVTYRQLNRGLELICHQCQTYYRYPNKCPSCGSDQLYSKYGGIEELVEILERETKLKPTRLDRTGKIHSSRHLDSQSKKNIFILDRQDKNALVSGNIINEIEDNDELFVHTRLYDPSVVYTEFDRIVFVQAENLLSSADYLVAEEIIKSLSEVISQVNETTQLVFDTNSPELEIFQDLVKVHFEHTENISLSQWYLSFLEKEKSNRLKFGFPPFKNLLLVTTQEKSASISLDKLKIVGNYLNSIKSGFPDITWSSPYPAKFLKRRNLYSHHILIRYPNGYKSFSSLRREIAKLRDLYNLQVRLNPRHLF
ncbi:MAG: hypothetical protein AAGF07_02095 [Patescibacteria group bacterium]